MNSATNTACAEAPTLTSARRPVLNEEALDQALQVNVLLTWIERARFLTDALAFLGEHYPEFAKTLRAQNIAFHSADWGDGETDALNTLLLIQWQLMGQIRQEVH